ncbi:homeobox protein engrailed-1-like isoform X2 [Panicum virgatum]|uniref:homeobox protein engrailed-1-like isoform X2 n=1 Tax=Panicum virgatum TaxID=38727 RepID=UPI0019D52D7A|nr:homeobox protein engrailed-1-like isoform X2 [Panicum virgatum]
MHLCENALPQLRTAEPPRSPPGSPLLLPTSALSLSLPLCSLRPRRRLSSPSPSPPASVVPPRRRSSCSPPPTAPGRSGSGGGVWLGGRGDPDPAVLAGRCWCLGEQDSPALTAGTVPTRPPHCGAPSLRDPARARLAAPAAPAGLPRGAAAPPLRGPARAAAGRAAGAVAAGPAWHPYLVFRCRKDGHAAMLKKEELLVPISLAISLRELRPQKSKEEEGCLVTRMENWS